MAVRTNNYFHLMNESEIIVSICSIWGKLLNSLLSHFPTKDILCRNTRVRISLLFMLLSLLLFEVFSFWVVLQRRLLFLRSVGRHFHHPCHIYNFGSQVSMTCFNLPPEDTYHNLEGRKVLSSKRTLPIWIFKTFLDVWKTLCLSFKGASFPFTQVS